MFPIIPVVATAATAALGYILFGDKKSSAPIQPAVPPPQPAAPPTPAMKPIPIPSGLGRPVLNPDQYPQNRPLPTPAVVPIPIPVVPIVPNIVPPPPPQPAPPPPQPAPLPIPPPNIEPTLGTATVTAPSGINLRTSPDGAILYGMVLGTVVKVLNPIPAPPTSSAPKGWLNVLAPNGMSGWASAEWLSTGNGLPGPLPNILPDILPNILPTPPSPNSLPNPVIVGTITGSPGANLRNSPSTSGAILVGLFKDTMVTILDPTPTAPTTGAPKGWYRVQSPAGMTGYISAEFVRIEAPGTAIHGEREFRLGRHGLGGKHRKHMVTG